MIDTTIGIAVIGTLFGYGLCLLGVGVYSILYWMIGDRIE